MPEYNPLPELSFPCSTSPTTLGTRKIISAFDPHGGRKCSREATATWPLWLTLCCQGHRMLLAGLLHHTMQETQGCFQPELALEMSACAHSAAGTKLSMHQLGGKANIRNQTKNSSPNFQGWPVSVHSHDLAKPRTEESWLLWGLGPKAEFSSHTEVSRVLWVQARLELQSGGLNQEEINRTK